ncbi:MAG: AMP-binding protein, partial [Acidobacteriaceae bacterium]|nr:AMP-binding protein [Acidobacteriaceae bacterium]
MSERTVFRVLEETAEKHPDLPALHQPLGKGKYQSYTWKDYRDAAQEIACGLHALGVAKGDIVTNFSETRAEFYLADLGIMAMGAISSALYTSNPLPDLVRVIRSSGSKVVFVEDPKSLKSLRAAAGEDALALRFILLTGEEDDTLTLQQLRTLGREAMQKDAHLFERLHSAINPDDNAILYSTSGATGEPKLGLVSHRAVVFNMDHGPKVLPIREGDRALVFLPSAHIAQRVVMELLLIRCSCEAWFSEGLARMPNELKTVKPTFLLAPPRVWERVFASVNTEVKKKSALQQK